MYCLRVLIAYGVFAAFTSAHMQMSEPFPLRCLLDPAVSSSIKDYSGTTPLAADGSNFPCKGYQNDRPILTTATYTAGNTYQMTLAGSATHGGGSCQISMSYDNGATFRVIKSMIGGCPLVSSYDFTIPSYAPNGTALLAWSWYNLVGNREMYMNGAWVDIVSAVTAPSKRSPKTQRRAFATFEQLPYIWKANLPGINTCVTLENDAPVFPNPGPDVIYGGSYSASSPVTAGDCDAPTPYGAAYKMMVVSAAGQELATYPDNAAAVSVGSQAPPSTVPIGNSSFSAFTKPTTTSSATIMSTSSTTMITTSIAYTISSPMSTTFSTSRVHLSIVPIVMNATMSATSSAALASSSTVYPTSILTTTLSSSTAVNTPSTSATSSEPPTSLVTSISSASTTSFITSLASSSAAASPSLSLMPNGACSPSAAMGSLACLRDGAGWAICNWSAWVDMGSVAPGTVCRGAPGSVGIVGA